MNERKPWQPRIREEPLFNPFEPSTEWTKDLGANDRIEIPDEDNEEADRGDAQQDIKNENPE